MASPTNNNPTSSYDDGTLDTNQASSYAMTGNLMVTAIVVLSLVILLIAILHVYARMFWGRASAHGGSRHPSWRRRHRVDMNAQEPFRAVGITGLEKAIVESLPTFTYDTLPSGANVLECAVCLSEFQEGEKGRLLPNCNHSFHTECIDMWFQSHSTCPLCRTSARPDLAAAVGLTGQNEDASTGISFVVFEPQSLRDSEPTEHLESSEQVDSAEASIGATPTTQTREDDLCEELLPSPGRRWNSERSPQNQGIQFPTNVLFWGNQTHISSRVSSPRSELGQPGTRSLPHIVIEVPRRAENLFSPRRPSFSSPRYSSAEEQPYTSPNGQPLKSPVGRLKRFKRMVSRETKAFPSEHEDGGECGQAGAISST